MDADGDFVIAWQSRSRGEYDVFARRYNAAGQPVGGEFLVNTTRTGSFFEPAVAMDPAGDFVVVWECWRQFNAFDVYFQRFNADGVAQGNEHHVGTFSARNHAVVSMDSPGDFVVSWESGGRIYAQRYDAPGSPQGNEIRADEVVTATASAPSVAMNAAGDFTIVSS